MLEEAPESLVSCSYLKFVIVYRKSLTCTEKFECYVFLVESSFEMLRFFKPNDKELFRWCGVIQSNVIKSLYSNCEFAPNDIKSLIQFCFPTDQQISGPLYFVFRFRSSKGQFYNAFALLDQTSFQLKDMDTNQQSVICLISEFYHPKVFEEILKAVRSLLLHSIQTTERFLKAAVENLDSSTIPSLSKLYYYHNFNHFDTLSNPKEQNEQLKKYKSYLSNDLFITSIVKLPLQLLSPVKIGRIIVALLTDTPIIVISSDLSKLSTFCFSIVALIYPLAWHHIFAPVLPIDLIDSVSSPAPFIVGLHRSLVQKAMNCDIEGHLLIDVDENGCTFSERNLPSISPYATQLIARLDKNAALSPHINPHHPRAVFPNPLDTADFRMLIVLLICTFLGIQPANNKEITIKRIVNALDNSKFDTNTFAFSLLQSRTLRTFFDAIHEPKVPTEFLTMVSLANTSRITSLAIQTIDDFPVSKKRFNSVQRSKSLQIQTSNDKLLPMSAVEAIHKDQKS